MDGKDFSNYLEKLRLRQRHPPSNVAVANGTGVSPTTVLRWRNEGVVPDPVHAIALAKYFHVDPVEVLAAAGHIPQPSSEPQPDDGEREVVQMWRGMSPVARAVALTLLDQVDAIAAMAVAAYKAEEALQAPSQGLDLDSEATLNSGSPNTEGVPGAGVPRDQGGIGGDARADALLRRATGRLRSDTGGSEDATRPVKEQQKQA